MDKLKTMILISMAALLTLAAFGGCVMEGEASSGEAIGGDVAGSDGTGAALAASLASGAPMSLSAALPGTVAAGEAGIWVTGEGSVTMEPDLAVLRLGVEVIALPLSDANATAATAMAAIMESLAANGVEEKDIQTHDFDIRPRYEWVEEVSDDGRRSGRDELVGYRVRNNVTAKVRDLDTIGAVIDDAILAGGDATRFDDLRFTVEDTSEVMEDLREAAVMDAMDKAQRMADTAGVTLGSLAYIADARGSGGSPVYFESAALRAAPAPAAAAPVTSISGGELEVTLFVNAAFAIE